MTSKSGGENTENDCPEPQSARACAVQTLFVTIWENSKLHRKYLHFSSLFLSFFVPFSSIFQESLKRSQGSRPRVFKRHKNGSQGCPNGAQGSQNGAPRSPSTKKKKCTKGVKMEPQVSQWGPKVTESAKKTQKGPPKCY